MGKITLKSGFEIAKNYVLPIVKTIAKSFISRYGKTTYEKLYKHFTEGLVSFETALSKCLNSTDVKKLKKHIECAKLGLAFYEQVHITLDSVLAEYNAIILESEERLKTLEENSTEIEIPEGN